jgi:hypothetical protein
VLDGGDVFVGEQEYLDRSHGVTGLQGSMVRGVVDK